jgi:hypothetical protein
MVGIELCDVKLWDRCGPTYWVRTSCFFVIPGTGLAQLAARNRPGNPVNDRRALAGCRHVDTCMELA